MKRFYFLILIALSLFTVSGCGGSSSSSGDSKSNQIPKEVRQVIVLSSPAIERNKRYIIYKGSQLSGMSGSRYFIANTGSTAAKSTIVLALCEPVSDDETFIIVNDSPDDAAHNGAVVFAYDPYGVTDEVLNGGSISFIGGSRMYYQSLELPDELPSGYYVRKNFTSDRGTTEFTLNPSYTPSDPDYYEPRNVPAAGYVFRITREVNIYSDMIVER